MTIDKAIAILSDSAYGGMTTLDQHFKDACKLGIEALTIIQKERRDSLSYTGKLLPGEMAKLLVEVTIKNDSPRSY